MIQKDYYSILGLRMSATPSDIKRSYRKLAMKYHPDKNDGDLLAEAVFREIAEAYEILSDARQREDYDARNRGNLKNQQPAITKRSILQDSYELKTVIDASDPFRVNRDAIYFKVTQILSAYNIAFLKTEQDIQINRRVIDNLLGCSLPLSMTDTRVITEHLIQLAGDDETAVNNINAFLQRKHRSTQWNKYKVVIAVVVALALCLLIFLLSK